MQFYLLQHILTLLRYKLLELISNCLQIIWFLFVQFIEQFHLLILLVLDEVLESIAFAQELWLRLHKHFLPEGLQHLLTDIPIEDVHHPCLLLRVELICFLQIVNEIGLVNDVVALCFVELPRLLDELLVKVYSG